jgi:saccharopine dehydrogenase-like NADP-dependent oxidoreductase
MSKRVFIAGSGGIGRAVGLLLRELGELEVDLILGDAYMEQAESAVAFIKQDSQVAGSVTAAKIPFEGNSTELTVTLSGCDLILDCLPGGQAPRVAAWALKHGLHYANLTEYVAETKEIMEMAKDAKTGFALQCGLAPGMINVLAMRLFDDFCERFEVEKVDVVRMRVGALTQNAEAPHFYGFTWSPVGVATEYVKQAEVVRDYKTVLVDSLEQVETLLLDGLAYEEATTSGGAADLPEALAGRVRNLDYKTLRYPGHWAWVKGELAKIGDGPERIDKLQDLMQSNIPEMEDDVVVVYASVEGQGSKGRRHRLDAAYMVLPEHFGGQRLRAIQSTTAAGMAEVARLLLTDEYQGVMLQSALDPELFLNGPYVGAVYGVPNADQ